MGRGEDLGFYSEWEASLGKALRGRGTGEGLSVDGRRLVAMWGTVGRGEPREKSFNRGLDQVGSPGGG